MGASMINPDLRRKIKVKKRPDLIVKKQRFSGQNYYVVKDPVSLRYYRFREEELFLLDKFDGFNNLDDIRHDFVERFRPQRISIPELERFAGQLLQAGIATTDSPLIGPRLYERYQKHKWNKVKQFFTNILYIKLPVYDPDRLLTTMLPYTRFLFTIPFFLLACMFGLSALLLILVNWDVFVAKLPSYHEFFTWRNLAYFWITLAIVKVMHEFGHGLSCKAFGGEVHEMGFLFLVLTPALYCNVTDAWMLPNKWHRVVIGAAGMYVELILSSFFVFTWWYTEPGLLNTLSLAIIFICSVSTVIFNGNPLLRFDGYYILSDLMEIPNLRERSNKYLGNLASKLFFNAEAVQDPYMPRDWSWFFPVYAVSAYVYRWVVTIGILWFLYTFLKPYKLGTISYLIGTAAAFSMFLMPLYSTLKFVRSRWRAMKVDKMRMVYSISAAVLILLAILFTPLPMWIDAPMLIQPADAVTVFVQVPGTLKEILVKDGDKVPAGNALGKLDAPELERQRAQARVDAETYEKMSFSFRALDEPNRAQVADSQKRGSQELINSIGKEIDKLTLMAPPGVSGTVFSPPQQTHIGESLKAGQPFCKIGDPKRLEAYIVIEHSDTSLIHPGQDVKLKLAGHVGAILHGQIERISTTQLESLPPALSNKSGGEVATTHDEKRNVEVPMFRSYSVQVPLPNEDGKLVAGVRGLARIDVGYRSIYWRIKRYLQQTFHFRL